MKHKKILIGLCALVVLAVAGLSYILLRPANDKDYVAKQYDQIVIPQSLQFKEKKWDDRNALDPAINSAWVYTYTINTNADVESVANDLKSSFKKQGFNVEDENSSRTTVGATLSAKNDKLDLWIVIGVDAASLDTTPRAGQEVLVMTEKSE